MGKIHLVAEGVRVACLLLYPKPKCRPSRSQKAAQPGISVVREGIMMSHPLAKVHAERMEGGGGCTREISKHGNVYLKFRLK